MRMLVGTYTERILFGSGKIMDGKGEGIYLLEFDPEALKMRTRNVFRGIKNPSWFVCSHDHKYLWVVNECKDYDVSGSGSVSAFRFTGDLEGLEQIDQCSSYGGDPCHVIADPQEQYILVSNYAGGSLSVYGVEDGGKLKAVQTVWHTGRSILPRQAAPHVHSIRFRPGTDRFFAADLGTDRLVQYRWESGKAGPTGADILLPEGSGPRQFAFSPDGKYGYIVDELSGCVSLADMTALNVLETWSALAPGISVCSEVQISRDGSFLYLADKGTNTISIFSIERENGKLSPVNAIPCGGGNPRHIALSPRGRYLFCANQDSDCITVFAVDSCTGNLEQVLIYDTPTPVYINIF